MKNYFNETIISFIIKQQNQRHIYINTPKERQKFLCSSNIKFWCSRYTWIAESWSKEK